jgi:hypothetical protein
MGKNPDRWPIVAVGLCSLLAGCHGPLVPPPKGQGSFSFIEPPPPTGQKPASVAVSEEAARYRPPVIVNDLATPIYPAAALAAHAGAATIDAQITIGTDGRIADFSPSPLGLAMLGRFSQEFSDAIERALGQWRFQPAEMVHFERGTDPQDSYLRITSTEPVPAYFEVKFRFTENGRVSFMPADR